MTKYLFTYGTLLKGIGHPMHEFLEHYAIFKGPGYINGKLYNVADYPALVLSNNVRKFVKGEIYQIQDEHALFKHLDAYEGCAQHSRKPFEYQRDLVTIQDDEQNSLLAWTYLYKHPVNHLPLIATGDYLAYRNEDRFNMGN